MNVLNVGSIIIWIMFVFFLLIFLIVGYYFIKFIKLKVESSKYYSKFQLVIFSSLVTINLILQIINIILELKQNLFVNLFNIVTNKYTMLPLILFVLSLITLLTLIFYIYFIIEYIAIAFDNNTIYFISQKINYSQIKNISASEKCITINYLEKERFKKKISFFKKSKIAHIILNQKQFEIQINEFK